MSAEFVDEKLARRTVSDVRRLTDPGFFVRTDVIRLLEAIAVSAGRVAADVDYEWQLLDDWRDGVYRSCCVDQFRSDTGSTEVAGDEYREWLLGVLEAVLADPDECDNYGATAELLGILSAYIYADHRVTQAARIAARKGHPIQPGGQRSLFDREVGKVIKVVTRADTYEMGFSVSERLKRARAAQFPVSLPVGADAEA